MPQMHYAATTSLSADSSKRVHLLHKAISNLSSDMQELNKVFLLTATKNTQPSRSPIYQPSLDRSHTPPRVLGDTAGTCVLNSLSSSP